jgi:hypothetical protein
LLFLRVLFANLLLLNNMNNINERLSDCHEKIKAINNKLGIVLGLLGEFLINGEKSWTDAKTKNNSSADQLWISRKEFFLSLDAISNERLRLLTERSQLLTIESQLNEERLLLLRMQENVKAGS